MGGIFRESGGGHVTLFTSPPWPFLFVVSHNLAQQLLVVNILLVSSGVQE